MNLILNKINILITGASGMLGAALVNELKDEFNVYATGNSTFEGQYDQYKKFDLQSEVYDDLINWSNPNIIIHCAALTNGNFCEENPGLAFDINGISVYKFLNATAKDVKIIYISTDAVFPSLSHLSKESECADPENIYGKSKELGEFFLRKSFERKFVIIRTTIVGLNKNKNKTSLVEWIINQAKNNEKIGLFSDVLFSPLTIWDLSSEIKFLIKSNYINSEILHIAGDICDKYQFGSALLGKLDISKETLFKSSISLFKERAKRSSDQSLDSSFYQKKYKRKLPNLAQTILNIKTKIHEEY